MTHLIIWFIGLIIVPATISCTVASLIWDAPWWGFGIGIGIGIGIIGLLWYFMYKNVIF